MAQGKAYDKEKLLKVLEPFLKLGYTRNKACTLAGIDASVVYKWEKEDPELSVKIDSWIEFPNQEARRNIVNKITDEKDVETSKWWVERRDKDSFSPRQENINENTNIEIKKTIEDKRDD